jgi:hypothetical protein
MRQLLLTVVLAASVLATFNGPLNGQRHAPPPSVGGVSLDDVIRMSRAGLSDDIIIQQVRKRYQPFDLSPDQLIQLKTAHVSDRVIQAMSEAPSAGAPAPGATAPVSAPSNHTSTADSSLPTEIGVYAKQQGKWIDVLPEVVNWKTGGVGKSVASLGVVKGDVNGHVNGGSSHSRFAVPIEFLIVVPEGIAITEYQLLHLHQHGDSREFRTVTGGVFHVSGGATRDLMQFEGRKIAPRTFVVSFSAGSGFGEYGFLPPGAFASMNAASSGKIYSFGVIE